MTKISCLDICERFANLVASTAGSDPRRTFSKISPAETPEADSLIFILQPKQVTEALASPVAVVLAPPTLAEAVGSSPKQQWIFSPNPELLMRNIKAEYIQASPYRAPLVENRAPSAFIDPTAELHSSVKVAPGAFIGARVKLGAHTFVGANAVVEADVVVGEHTTLHPLSYIGHSCVIGNRCEVLPQACIGSEGYGYAHDAQWNHYRIPHTGKVILEDDVHVGAGSAIDRGTLGDSIIGCGTKIDNQCHLAHNSVVGKNGLITAQFGMAGSSTIGNNFVCGGKTSVSGHLKITDNVQISGMSGVTKSIDKAGSYGGFPLQNLQDSIKTRAALTQLHDMRMQFRELLKKLKP